MRLFTLSLVLLSSQVYAEVDYWQDKTSDLKDQRVLSLDVKTLNVMLLGSTGSNNEVANYDTDYSVRKGESQGQGTKVNEQIISLPLPDGKNAQLWFEETHVMAPQLAKKYPAIKTYKVSGINEPGLQGRMTISGQGFHAALQTRDGRSFIIKPGSSKQGDLDDLEDTTSTTYHSVWSVNQKNHNNVAKKTSQQSDIASCQLTDHEPEIHAFRNEEYSKAPISSQVDANIYIYRIAVSASSSYVNAHGGTKATAMAAIAQTINRVNQVYERDTGIRLQLVANNDQLVFTSDDPFSGSLNDMLSQNQSLIDRVIGSENYDVGHLFTSRGGGLAYVGSACRSNIKAMGVSGNISVGRERYALEFVAHEIAHQFSATHTFNSNQGLCSESNRNGLTAYEPGSGSTIMSYIGICGSDNLQNHADAMFHIGSIQQIVNHKSNHQVNGCGVLASVGDSNNAPEVNAGADFTIPANTPFELEGVASDSDKDTMLYNWEQQDSGIASKVDKDTGNNALFRSYLPTVSKQRTFPRKEILLGLDSTIGETLPTTNREMHFEFIAHDSKGGSVSDSMRINVVTDEKTFHLHAPPQYYTRGEDINVTWEVANTNLPPISCSSVDVSLSTDNGLKFDQVLASNIPNSGAAAISLPASVTEQTQARLKISCSDNIFFTVSSRAFGTATHGTTITNASTTVSSGGGGSLSTLWLFLLSVLSLYSVSVRNTKFKLIKRI